MLTQLSQLYRNLSHTLSGAKFVLEVEAGGIRLRKGKMLNRLLREIQEIISKHEVASGWIRGFEGGGFTRWEFSADIPSALHQNLRNVLCGVDQ